MISNLKMQGLAKWKAPFAKLVSGDCEVLIDHKDYEVGIATSARLKYSVYRLRKQIFGKEYQLNYSLSPLERDSYDRNAEHLVVKCKKKQKLVACYRLIQADSPTELYSGTEFQLDSIFNMQGKKLELSRACIHEDYRNGVVLSLLWKGLSKYCFSRNVRFLIGIPSIKTECPDNAEKIYQYFASKNLISDQMWVEPIHGFANSTRNFKGQPLDEAELKEISKLIPPLMKVYLKAGARVCGRPAFDPIFSSCDFFIVLDFQDLNAEFERRYRGKKQH